MVVPSAPQTLVPGSIHMLKLLRGEAGSEPRPTALPMDGAGGGAADAKPLPPLALDPLSVLMREAMHRVRMMSGDASPFLAHKNLASAASLLLLAASRQFEGVVCGSQALDALGCLPESTVLNDTNIVLPSGKTEALTAVLQKHVGNHMSKALRLVSVGLRPGLRKLVLYDSAGNAARIGSVQERPGVEVQAGALRDVPVSPRCGVLGRMVNQI